MADFALISPYIHVHDVDLTTSLRKITVHPTVEELDVTTFASGSVARIGGLKTVEAVGEGFWDSVPDASIFGNLGAIDNVATFCAEGAETKTAYMVQVGRFDYSCLGDIGAVAPFSTLMHSTNKVGMVRGQLAKAKGTVAATGALGSGLNLGAVGALQFVYATFHVFVAATTITIQVQSDTANNFPAPTVRGTIGPLTVTGGTWMTRVAGPFTDTWWRFNVSVVTGTFTVAGAIGIQ